MARHAAKQNRWARRAVVAGALPELPQIEVPPLYNPVDLNERPFNFLRPGYAPTQEQRIADYTDTGQLLGAYTGSLVGALGSTVVGGGAITIGAIAAGIVGPAALGPVSTALGAVTVGGLVAGGSLGAELGGQAGAGLARQQNAPLPPLS
ncbi:hypothetical protein A6F59_07400 [Prescottella equi]|nr:hypothetical protein A6F59_07400 [Prescottella equi]